MLGLNSGQLGALERAVRRRKLLVRHLVSDVLHDRRALGEERAVVEP